MYVRYAVHMSFKCVCTQHTTHKHICAWWLCMRFILPLLQFFLYALTQFNTITFHILLTYSMSVVVVGPSFPVSYLSTRLMPISVTLSFNTYQTIGVAQFFSLFFFFFRFKLNNLKKKKTFVPLYFRNKFTLFVFSYLKKYFFASFSVRKKKKSYHTDFQCVEYISQHK